MVTQKYLKKGFTLIELLIVIAILGVLAVVVLVAINPLEQLARTRDAGRISSVTQIGHATQAYYTSQNAVYPTVANWSGATGAGSLIAAGELTALPSAVAYSVSGVSACAEADGAAVANSTWCYDTTAANGAIVYATLESNSNNAKCPTATPKAWALYSTAMGRAGVVCTAAATVDLDPAATWTFY
jgi:prepilin-type N-terminal cleavage/methylation domain-containing protein